MFCGEHGLDQGAVPGRLHGGPEVRRLFCVGGVVRQDETESRHRHPAHPLLARLRVRNMPDLINKLAQVKVSGKAHSGSSSLPFRPDHP